MNSKHIVLLSILLFVFFQFAFAQVGVGQWQDHLPYAQATYVAESATTIYTATAEALFSYDKNTGETQRLNKVTGLSDVGVSSIAYSLEYNTLVIGYTNGNIDLLKNKKIINIADIKRKTISSEKSINHILFIDEYAVLSTGFGIVVLDVDRQEIKSTWYIADMGAFLNIYETDFDGKYLYAATESGIYRGDYINANLADFSQWEIITNTDEGGHPWLEGKSFNTLEYFNDNLIVNKHATETNQQDTLYTFNTESGWSLFPDTSIHHCNYLTGDEEHLLINRDYNIFILDKNYEGYDNVYLYRVGATDEKIAPNPAIGIPSTEEGGFIIADRQVGLIRHISKWYDEKVTLNGPFSSNVFDISSAGNNVWIAAGGINLSWTPTYKKGEINYRQNNEWHSINYLNNDTLKQIRDIIVVKVNPFNPSQVFAGSWIHGLIEFNNNQVSRTYDENSSTLQTLSSMDNIRIGGLDFDEDQNLWVVNSGSAVPIHMRTPDNKWYGLDYSSQINEYNIGEILVTQNDHKWVVLPRGGGLFAFDDNDTPDDMSDDRTKKLSIRDEYGQIISNEVFSIAEDLDGSIWVGTNVGVVVYYDPEDVFDENIVAHQILIPRNDGTNNADILLGAETVTAICVDGSNKKWFGTENGGVFKTSEDGIEEIYHFNKDNSPLFSNNILAMDINQESGEVYIGTNTGVLSYRGEATQGENEYSDVYTFPNPVEHDYDGPITVHGLIAGSIVKITDISGNLVYETRSEGGQAIWYGKDLNGNKVHTGVYLVFSANEDGTQSNVTKILFVN